MVEKIRAWLAGKKTYLVAASAVIAALIAFANGAVNILGLIEAVLAALGLTTLRAAVSKIIEALKKEG